MKTLDLKEFREAGYLQELNRRFLHPLGLAMALEFEKTEDGELVPTGKIDILDSRSDPEGYMFDQNYIRANIETFQKKKQRVDQEMLSKAAERIKLVGAMIQPI